MKKRLISLLLCVMMVVSLLPTSAAALGETVIARDKAESERDNVQMSKTVTEHLTTPGDPSTFDGTYDITLEAYANAYYKPVDVILVVDQSGSMTSNYGGNSKSNLANLKTALNTFADTLKDVDEQNTLTIIGFADEGSDFDNTELFINGTGNEFGQSTQTPVYSADLDTDGYYCTAGGSLVYYNNNQWGYYTSGCLSSKWNTITPKASSGGEGEQLYEVGPTASQYRAAAAQVTVDEAVNPTIKTAINNLAGSGATYTNFGILMAEKALASRADQTRDAIVVLFTDGYPGDSAGDPNETAANLAIKYANEIKSDYKAKIYTVGLKGSDYSDMKTFLAKIQTTGADYAFNTEDSQNLPDLFKMIYKDVIGVNENMTAAVNLVETLSDKFELNGDISTAVSVSRVPYLNDGTTVWGTPVALTAADGISKTKTQNNSGEDVISISGFDYAKIALDPETKTVTDETNAVYYDSQGGNHGAKLRVVINVKPKTANNPCWDGVEYGKLEIVPTEKSALILGSKEVAAIKSSDSDYFEKFEVELHHLLVSVDDDAVLATGDEQASTKSVTLTPDADYSVTGYSYAAAKGTDASDEPYSGSFSDTDLVNVKYSNAEEGIENQDITKKSVVKFVPGTLKILDANSYVVTVNGNNVTVPYDGNLHSTTLTDPNTQAPYTYTYSVKQNGVPTNDLALGTDFTITAPANSYTDAGEYAMGITCQNISSKNIVFVINDGVLTINKLRITMTSASATKVHDGSALTKNNPDTDMTVTPGFVEGEGVIFTIKGSQTEVGTSDNWFTYTAQPGTKMTNYIVTERMGTLTVYDGTGISLSFYDKLLKKDTYRTDDTKTIIKTKALTLDLNGGTLDLTGDNAWTAKRNGSGVIISYTKKNIQTPQSITYIPTKDNCIFDGWQFSADSDQSGNVTLTAQWLDDSMPKDETPDDYEKEITFAVVNGAWDDETDGNKTVYIELFDGEGNWSESGSGKLTAAQIPAVGTKPTSGYQTGAWDTEPNDTDAIAYNAAGTYTYTYAAKSNTVEYPGPKQNPPTQQDPPYKPQETAVKTDHTVTLVLDGGAFSSTDLTALGTANWNTTTYTKTITADDDSLNGKYPTKSGFVFNGWTKSWTTTEADGNITLTAQWLEDKIGGPNPGTSPNPDGIPDMYQFTVTFKIKNGKWGTSEADIKVVLTRTVGGAADGEWSNEVGAWANLKTEDIPNNMTANSGFGDGSWGTGTAVPDTTRQLTVDTSYEFSYKANANKVGYPGQQGPGYEPKELSVETGHTVTLVLDGGEYQTAPSGYTASGVNYVKTIDAADDTLIDPSAYPTKTDCVFDGWVWSWTTNEADGNITLTAQWMDDKAPEDDIPDPYEKTVTFVVVNGTWDDGTSEEKTATIGLFDGDKWSKTGSGKLGATQIPKVGTKPGTGYVTGAWDTEPTTSASIAYNAASTVYTYTFAAKDNELKYYGPLQNSDPTYTPKTENVVTGKYVILNLNAGTLTNPDDTMWDAYDQNSILGYVTKNPVNGDINIASPAYIPARTHETAGAKWIFNGWTASTDGDYVILTAQWLEDKVGGPKDPDDPTKPAPDDIPDDYQVFVNFKVINGTLNTASFATVKLELMTNDVYDVNGSAKLSAIPADGTDMTANEHFGHGSWGTANIPSTNTELKANSNNNTYSYTFSYVSNKTLTYPRPLYPTPTVPTPTQEIEDGKTVTLNLDFGAFSAENARTLTNTVGWAYRNGNGVTVSDTYTKAITANMDISGTTYHPTKEGYVFNGWSAPVNDGNGNYTLTAQWLEDKIGGDPDPLNPNAPAPDGIPDEYELTVTFTISNGVWVEGTTNQAPKKVVLVKLDGDGEYSATGVAKLKADDIPTGMTADTGYANGKWSPAAPDTATELTADKLYEYSFDSDKVLSYLGHDEEEDLPKDASVTMHYGRTITLVLAGGEFDSTIDMTGWTYTAGTYTRKITTNLSIYDLIPTRDAYSFYGWSFSWTTTEKAGDVTLTAQWKAKGSIWGIVTDNGNPQKGILVKLCQGNTVLQSTTTDELGFYSFPNVAIGEYDVVAIKDFEKDSEKTKTVLVAVETPGVPKEVNIALPQTGVSSILEVEPGTPDIVVGKLDDLAADRAAALVIADNEKLEVKLKTSAVTYDASNAEMLAIETQKTTDGRKMIEYFSFQLLETLSGRVPASENYTDKDIGALNLNTQLLQINIPFQTAGRTNFVVYRNHNGVVDTLTATPNTDGEYIVVKSGMITVFAKNFSYYAVAFDPIVTPGPMPAEPTYAVHAPEYTKYGQVSISKSEAAAGDDVIVTTVPDQGYRAQVSVTDDEGKVIILTEAPVGVFTFEMPASDVYVSVKFICLRDEYCPIEPFDDTLNDYWWHDGVHFCLEEGYMIGFPDGSFQPYGLTTRAQIASIFWRIAGCPTVDYEITFTDVLEDAWYTEAIRWAEATGVVFGYSEDFYGPNDPITREQLAAIIYRYAQSLGKGFTGSWMFLLDYSDRSDISSWAYEAACWCSMNGIVVGDDGAYKPLAKATRAEAACMIQRFCEIVLGM